MNKLIFIFYIFSIVNVCAQTDKKIISRQGHVSFFSYTSVENIEASNNQVLSIISLKNDSIAVDMLMRAFVFKKALMREHFNESYVESDIYPKLRFLGKIKDFDQVSGAPQTTMILGMMDFHGVKKKVNIKVDIKNLNGKYTISGDFEVGVADYNIKVPPLLAPNIAKNISVNFIFEYEPHE